jgi:uncharacterized membrane protein YidH (DUF202 family)
MDIHVFWGLLIPVGFLGFAGMAKSLVRSCWTWANFYLGIDLSLAALANGIVNIVDVVHQAESGSTPMVELLSKVNNSALCVFIAIGALFGTMAFHQRFEILDGDQSNHRLRRGILLGLVSNLLGASVLAAFIVMKLWRLI